jgi:hypothetical protein
MQFDWRAICGPALTTGTALIAISADRHFVVATIPATPIITSRCAAELRRHSFERRTSLILGL